jgi:adhesin/invasin
VTVRDSNGNPVGESAGEVILSTTLGELTEVVDHGDGTYTAVLRSIEPGTAVITGTLNGDAIGQEAQVEVSPGPADPGTTTITADPPQIVTSGTEGAPTAGFKLAAIVPEPEVSTVTVTVRDANGNAVGQSAGTVALATTLGTLTEVVDHGNGTYTAELRSSETGTAVVTGTLNGEPIDDSAEVEIKPAP